MTVRAVANLTAAAHPSLVTSDDADDFADWIAPHLKAMGLLAARLAGPAEREDLVQDSLTRAWRKRNQFDTERGTPRAWLLAIVADRARRHWRRRQMSPPRERIHAIPGPDAERIDLERAIATLPARMRLAIECVYILDLTIRDTAVVMGISEGTVKSTLSRAREHLKSVLEEQ